MSFERIAELQERSWALQAEGRLVEACEVGAEALRLVEESAGPDSPDTANLLNELAELETERGAHAAALALAQRARSIVTALGRGFAGEDAARIRLKTCAVLGELLRLRDEYAGSEREYRDGLALALAQFGEDSAEVAEARNDLAILYKYWGRWQEARALYEQALATFSLLEGEQSLGVGAVLHNLGGILHIQGDCEAAEPYARRAWEISRELLGEDNPRTLRDLGAWAAVLDGLQRQGETVPIYRRLLAAWRSGLDPGQYEIATTLHNLASALESAGSPVEAEAHYREALAIKRATLGEDVVDTALTRNNLGRLLAGSGRDTEAVEQLQLAVSALERRLDPAHPHLAAARGNLAEASAVTSPGSRTP